jgi:hypothetical protein
MKVPNLACWLCLIELVLSSPASVLGQGVISPMIPSNSVSHMLVIGDTQWLGTGKGLSRSVDHGQSWENFRRVSEFASPGIFSLAVEGNTVWSSTGFE